MLHRGQIGRAARLRLRRRSRTGGGAHLIALTLLWLLTSSIAFADDTVPAGTEVLAYQVTNVETEQVLYTTEVWSEPVTGHAEQTATISRIVFPQGSKLRQWAIFTTGQPPTLVSWGASIRDAAGNEVAGGYSYVRQEAFPFLTRPLPPNTYPPEASLGYVLGVLGLGRRVERTNINLILMGSSIVELNVWTDGREPINVPAGGFDTYRVRMQVTGESLFPNLPSFVRQFASFFIPTQTVWLTTEPPQRLVKFTGQIGPPGSPNLLIELKEIVGGPVATAR